MNRSNEIGELAAALAKAQAKIEAAPKDKTAKIDSSRGAGYAYKYATLAGIWEACRAPLAENGLAVVQTVTTEGAAAHVTTMLAHSSGQWIEETLTMTAADASPQKIGSAITYGRRYSLGAIVGVVTDDDDDGKAASENHSGQGYQRQNRNGNGQPTQQHQQQKPAPVPDEEQKAIRLIEACEAGFATAADKEKWQETHRPEFQTLSVAYKKAVKEAFDKAQVRS